MRLDGGRFQPQESHPRCAIAAPSPRVCARRWPSSRATLGGDLRLYRDTWGVQSLTGELSWQQPFRLARRRGATSVRARGYVQSGAIFYRDAGNADSYERAGPVGSYFTADQELAPLADLVSARASSTTPATSRRTKWRMFTAVQWAFSLDYVKMFALTPEPPNAPRLRSWASALVAGVAATGKF